jgi:hypothetical protein
MVLFFTIIHLYLFLKCLRSVLEPLDSLRSAGSVRRLSIQSNTKEPLIPAGGKSESPNIFFTNWLNSKVFTACRNPRFHFPLPALKNDRRTQLVNLACKTCSFTYSLESYFFSIIHRQQSHYDNWRSKRPQFANYVLFLQARAPHDSAPTHCTSRSCKGIPQSAWGFSLHQYLLWRLSTFLLNANHASSKNNKSVLIFYLSGAEPPILNASTSFRALMMQEYILQNFRHFPCGIEICFEKVPQTNALYSTALISPTQISALCETHDTSLSRFRADKITIRGRFTLLNPTRYFHDKLCRPVRVLRAYELSVLLQLT